MIGQTDRVMEVREEEVVLVDPVGPVGQAEGQLWPLAGLGRLDLAKMGLTVRMVRLGEAVTEGTREAAMGGMGITKQDTTLMEHMMGKMAVMALQITETGEPLRPAVV